MTDEYGPARVDDLDELASMLSWSFGFPQADAEPWLRKGGLENVRVLRRGHRVAATLLLIDHAQMFLGKRVPSMGVAGVATPATSRGDGAAKALMTAMLRELHARGVAASSLYPATLPLYRRVGYEAAGARFEITLPLAGLGPADRALPMRPMTSDDAPAVEACYRAHASRSHGYLDRSAYVWARVHNPRGETTRGFVAGEGDDVEGYVVLFQKRLPSGFGYSLTATDLVARTPRAGKRLLTFLADQGTLGDKVTLYGGPNEPLLHLVPSLGYEMRLNHHWMLRIVDVASALRMRGYPEAVRGSLELSITDDVLDANAGRWTLHVDGGRASVEHGAARPGLRMDVRALAPLFTGHMTPYALASMGHIEGTDAELAMASALFASPAPAMADFF